MCQLNDWRYGTPPHKLSCGKPVRLPDLIDPTPVASQLDVIHDDDSWLPPAAPGFVRSPALLKQLYHLHMDPSIVYILKEPHPAKPSFIALKREDQLPIHCFDAHKARAIIDGDPQAVGLMAYVTRQVSPRPH